MTSQFLGRASTPSSVVAISGSPYPGTPVRSRSPSSLSQASLPSQLLASASSSLQAAATLNAGLRDDEAADEASLTGEAKTPTDTNTNAGSHQGGSTQPKSESQSPSLSSTRRRSLVVANLQHNDPNIPGPGEMVASHSSSPFLLPRDSDRSRAPSLGELHQELEAEQEAKVNRLLLMIREQQLQLQQSQNAQGTSAEDSSAIASSSQPNSNPTSAVPHVGSLPRSHRPSFEFPPSRSSRTPSRGPSPRLRSTSICDEGGYVRDESAFYQAETQMVIRENQMLRHRIKELEKQLGDAHASITHEPPVHSHLHHAQSVSEKSEHPEREA